MLWQSRNERRFEIISLMLSTMSERMSDTFRRSSENFVTLETAINDLYQWRSGVDGLAEAHGIELSSIHREMTKIRNDQIPQRVRDTVQILERRVSSHSTAIEQLTHKIGGYPVDVSSELARLDNLYSTLQAQIDRLERSENEAV